MCKSLKIAVDDSVLKRISLALAIAHDNAVELNNNCMVGGRAAMYSIEIEEVKSLMAIVNKLLKQG